MVGGDKKQTDLHDKSLLETSRRSLLQVPLIGMTVPLEALSGQWQFEELVSHSPSQMNVQWQQATRFAPEGDVVFPTFGASVAVSAGTAIVGAPGAQNATGVVYVFDRTVDGWSQSARLTAADGDSGDRFGQAVAIDGATTLIGAATDEDPYGERGGAAYVFQRDDGEWFEEAKLVAGDGDPGDLFGTYVAVADSTALVGAPADEDPNGPFSGSAYVFERHGLAWTQQTKLTPDDGLPRDGFGTGVALDGDTALIAAEQDTNPNGIRAGSVYVYTRSDDGWTRQSKLLASDGDPGDDFGTAIDISGDTALIGADGDADPNGVDAGSAYIFQRSGETWTQQIKLAPQDGDPEDDFGTVVAIDNDTALIGADDAAGATSESSGAAYVFGRTGDSWEQEARLTPTKTVSGNDFADDLSLSGRTAVISGVGSDTSRVTTGAAYAFERQQPINLEDPIRRKQARITSFRNEVADTIDEGVLPDDFLDASLFLDETIEDVDQDAAEFIDDLERELPELRNSDLRQYREAIERLTAAEDVTLAAARGPNRKLFAGEGFPTIIEETVDALISSAIIVATFGLSKLVKPLKTVARGATRLRNNYIDQARELKASVFNNLTPKGRAVLTGTFDELKDRFSEIFENNREEIATLFEEAILEGRDLSVDLLVPDQIFDLIGQLKSYLGRLLYEYYIFSTDFFSAELSPVSAIEETIPTIDLPDTEDIRTSPVRKDALDRLSAETPDQTLIFPPELDLTPVFEQFPDRFRVDLPELDTYEETFTVLNDLDRGIRQATSYGLDPVIDDGVDDLERLIRNQSLELTNDTERDTSTMLFEGAVTEQTDLAEEILSATYISRKLLGFAAVVALIGAIVLLISGVAGVIFGVATRNPLSLVGGLGLLGLITTFGSLLVVITSLTTFVLLVSDITGGAYLGTVDTLHFAGTNVLFNGGSPI